MSSTRRTETPARYISISASSTELSRRLAQQGVELASGDLDDPAAVQAALQGVSAAFSAQTFEGKGGLEAEERQGIP
jgi:uncharacterized protein YbjT (DUF2867 family)